MTTSSSSTSRAFLASGSASADSKLPPSSLSPTPKRKTKNGLISDYLKVASAGARSTTPTPAATPPLATPSTPNSRKLANPPRGYLREISTNSATSRLATHSPAPPRSPSLAPPSPASGAPRSSAYPLCTKLTIITSPAKDRRCEANPAMPQSQSQSQSQPPFQPTLCRPVTSAMSSLTDASRLSTLSSLGDSDTEMDHANAPSTPSKKPRSCGNTLHDESPDPFGSSPLKSPSPEPQRRLYSKDDVIQASDDDDDENASDSDGFTPLEVLIRGSASASAASNKVLPRSTVSAAHQSSPTRFPRVKRPATIDAFFKAKAVASRKAEFNLEALLEHAARDKLANERIQKASEDCAESHRQAKAMDAHAPAPASPQTGRRRASALKDRLHGVLEDNDEAPQIEKVVRAVERTDSSQTSRTWRFFVAADRDHTKEPRFPMREMRNILNDVPGGKGITKETFDIDVLYTRTYSVPSSMSYPVLEWLLKSVCTSASVVKSTRIFKCFVLSSATVAPLSPAVLHDCMRMLGAKEDVFSDTHELQMENEEDARGLAYDGRDWTRLAFVLLSLAPMVPYLTAESRLAAATLLVKMAADVEAMASTTVQTAYIPAIRAVFQGLDDDELDTYSMSLATVLLANFTHTSTHADILRALPVSPLAALRRQLAIAFLFRDAQRACYAVQTSFGPVQALKLLQTPVFAVHRDTDYRQLRGLIALLDIAIDDGCMPPTPDSEYYDELQGRELLREFNTDLDAVIAQLEALSRGIHDMNMSSMHPTEAKGQINILVHRLQHAVRYGGAIRTSVYDRAMANMAPRDTSMRKWSAAVKSGQAREQGQASIVGFARTTTGRASLDKKAGSGGLRVAFAQDLTSQEIEQRAARPDSVERRSPADTENAAAAKVREEDAVNGKLPMVTGDWGRFTPTPRSSLDLNEGGYLMSEMAETSPKPR